jgi:hypothetical protein
MKVDSISCTCDACPTQYEGTLSDGREIYIRYRHGMLTAHISPQVGGDAVGGKCIHSEQLSDDEMDGWISYQSIRSILDDVIDMPESPDK